MQRVLLILTVLFALYACTTVHASALKTEPAAQALIPPPPTAQTVLQPGPESGEQNEHSAHIALLLPFQSTNFGLAARSVQQGFMAAAGQDVSALPVRAYDIDENRTIEAVYRQAILNGARAVAGPLTRDGVAALAKLNDFPVPTLGLNIPETQISHKLYFFGLAVDAEAKQIAQIASAQGYHQAIVISANDQLARRLQFAFEAQWVASGGSIQREIDFNGDITVFSGIAMQPDTMIFFAADAIKARQIRPYLSGKLPVYGTSQLFSGNNDALANFDLDGIRFIDMPWLLQTDQPPAINYPRAIPPLKSDYERLYALGIDAYHLTCALLANEAQRPLAGVTGNIQLNDHVFQREALAAVFRQGHAQPIDAPAAVTGFPGASGKMPSAPQIP